MGGFSLDKSRWQLLDPFPVETKTALVKLIVKLFFLHKIPNCSSYVISSVGAAALSADITALLVGRVFLLPRVASQVVRCADHGGGWRFLWTCANSQSQLIKSFEIEYKRQETWHEFQNSSFKKKGNLYWLSSLAYKEQKTTVRWRVHMIRPRSPIKKDTFFFSK